MRLVSLAIYSICVPAVWGFFWLKNAVKYSCGQENLQKKPQDKSEFILYDTTNK